MNAAPATTIHEWYQKPVFRFNNQGEYISRAALAKPRRAQSSKPRVGSVCQRCYVQTSIAGQHYC